MVSPENLNAFRHDYIKCQRNLQNVYVFNEDSYFCWTCKGWLVCSRATDEAKLRSNLGTTSKPLFTFAD